MLEAEISKWALDFERRAQDILQRSIGSIPAPKDGRDGKDGIGFDDLSVDHDGLGNVTLKFIRGADVKSFDVRLPVILDCGIYRDGQEYSKGNGVSCAGSFWIAQVDNPSDRPGVSDQWRLAVKKGRDAKNVSSLT